MGNPPNHVFNVGPMVKDDLIGVQPASRLAFEQSTDFRFVARNVLITCHQETLLPDQGLAVFVALLRGLKVTPCHALFTHLSAYKDADQLLAQLEAFVQRHSKRCWAIRSLRQKLHSRPANV